MPNKGCNNCTFYKRGEIKVWGPDTPRSCSLGNTEALNKWWADNGHKTGDLDDMPCFEETELNRRLREMSDLIEKITTLTSA